MPRGAWLHEDGHVPSPQAFPCPHCSTVLEPGLPACPACGLRLVGLDAARLWEVQQQIGDLELEAGQLIQRLLHEPAPASYTTPYPRTAPAGGTAYEVRRPHRSLSGQHLLLGLGALLLLSAAAFFLLVVWFVVGLAGQALIMAALTATAAAGAVLATRRGLTAAAETAAVIASGLVAIDLSAAHGLGLAGLDRFPTDTYWSVAGLVACALLLGFDRLVPREHAGTALRRVVVYRPVATAMLAVAGWSLLAALDPSTIVLCGLALLLAVLSGAAAAAAYRLDEPGRPGVPWSVVPLLVSTLVALLVHVLSGLSLGYDPLSTGGERYAAFALLLVAPVVLFASAAAGERLAPVGGDRLRVLAVLWLVPVVGIPLADAPRWLLVASAVALAAAVALDHLRPRPTAGTRPAWARALGWVAWVAQPVLVLVVFVVSVEGAGSFLSFIAGTSGAPADWWLPVVPAAAWAASSAVAAVRRTDLGWVVVAQAAAAVTLVIALRDSGSTAWAWGTGAAALASLALAGVTRLRARTPYAQGVEQSALVFAVLHGCLAVASSLDTTPGQLAAVLLTFGVATVVYAAVPGRLPAAYVGSLLLSAGNAVLLDDARVDVIEAYTLPLALLLAAIGVVQWWRDPATPTRVTMGPALSVALLPSLLFAVEEGGNLRLALVTAGALVVLLVGLAQRWQAPVAVGAVTLVVVALTQGGPFVEYVPTWVTLGLAGAALLAAGVAWEQAVLAGRRTTAWFAALR